MRKDYIKYEDLSSNVKKEIESFCQMKRSQGEELTINDAMLLWFEECFDDWMARKYHTGRGDRRTQGRRRLALGAASSPPVRDQRSDDRRKSVRRKNFRVNIEVPVRIVETLVEGSSEDDRTREFVGTLVNLSKGGFYFRSPKRFEIASIIRVIMDLSSIDQGMQNVEALAMVLRVEKLPEGDQGVGVLFSSIYDESLETLDLFIFKTLAYYIHTP